MSEKRILIERRDGRKLHAVQYLSHGEGSSEKKEVFPLIMICHGFTGDKYEWGRFPTTAKALNEAGFDALIFDFSGSGENEREFITLSKQARDLEDVYNWAKNEGYSWIGAIGLSFGGLTLLVANLPEVKTLVFWAPAFHLKNMFSPHAQENLKRKPLILPTSGKGDPIKINNTFVEELSKYDTITYLQNLSIPALIVQGTKDRAVRPRNIREAFKHLPQDDHHKLIEIENAGHDFDGDHLTQFIEVSINWLKNYF
ncbi:MAG: alpha/beta hydrolase [Promethearchaeota archaeon]